MAVTLNRQAYEHAEEFIEEGTFVFRRARCTERAPAVRTGAKMNSFVSMVLPNTANGIWESTTKSLKIQRDTMSFPYGDFKKVHRSGVRAGRRR